MSASLVVLISGRGNNLKSIAENINSGFLDAKITAVISNNRYAPGLKYADLVGADKHVVNHKDYQTREEFDKKLVEIIDKYHPNLVILAGFMLILGDSFVKHYQNRLINIHPSLLPKYKGTNTHRRALAAREKIHGATVHFVTGELDSGPIILQAEVKIKSDDTEESLSERVLAQERILYPRAIKKVLAEKFGTPSSHLSRKSKNME